MLRTKILLVCFVRGRMFRQNVSYAYMNSMVCGILVAHVVQNKHKMYNLKF